MDIRGFLLRIVLPTLLAVVLFIGLIFGILLPDFERSQLDRKRELIRELTRSAWSVLQEVLAEEQEGRLSPEEARKVAARRIRDLRYGHEGKDYFWITDMTPRMIMHPFRPDLEGQDLTEFRDPKGNPVFVAFVERVRESGSGYVDYVWQWKDDPGRMAPKESFVMGFEPWQWVIGTGIYTEDVKAEIASLTSRLVRISLLLVSVVVLILVFVSFQSLRIERRRSEVEQALKSSHDRFQALVESSANGTALVLEGTCVYANPVLEQMVGSEPGGLVGRRLQELMETETESPVSPQPTEAAPPPEIPREVRLRHASGRPVDALVRTTPISMEGRSGVILEVREIGRTPGSGLTEGMGLEGTPALETALPLGVFQARPGRKGILLSANPAARRILGYGTAEELLGISLMDHCAFPEDRDRISQALATHGIVSGLEVPIRQRQGRLRRVRLYATMVQDPKTRQPVRVEGLLEDVTESSLREQERQRIIDEAMEDHRRWEAPVSALAAPPEFCRIEDPAWKAAARMAQVQRDALLVQGPDGDCLGIVTDGDLRRRVLGEARDPDLPIYRVMTSPVECIARDAPAVEARVRLSRQALRHLVVRGTGPEVLGIVSLDDLARGGMHPVADLLEGIETARTVEEVVQQRQRLPALVDASLRTGGSPDGTARLITAVADGVTRRLLDLALAEAGPPPVPFAFLVLGSQGRHEQTLVTDQDNAILFGEVPTERLDGVREWFLRLGRRVCEDLDRCGYAPCPGGMMARNPQWVQPLNAWKDLFTRWIRASTPQDLLAVNMFFDFRPLAGSGDLASGLQSHIFQEMERTPAFFGLLAQNALLYKPPRGLFGKILTSAEGSPTGHAFNIKEAVLPLVNFGRLYALRHGVQDTTTLGRLEALHRRGHLSSQTYRDCHATYLLLMEIRLRHQAACIAQGTPPSNLVDPRELADVQEGALRRGLGQIATLLRKISFDFLGHS
ncbi:MAG TPA: DUF294 nucleotidyltransferase-like domain-containing protein [Myxococcota bacterium]|nr:DUF294 nucleotidyltransferase-like domain-containing protein [Myxococcota bacterium]HQK50379.1 DUF294 nucleotidyltransferase-like domain-containing protein [Myxococcota bacterium]